MKISSTPYSSSSSSSVKSNTTMEETETETRENNSCYFPGCKKDANCNCEICLASMNATLDLMPYSVQKSSLTKLSASRPYNMETPPISFDPSTDSTPTPRSCKIVESPPLRSTARMGLKLKEKQKRGTERGKSCIGGGFLRFVLVLQLFLAIEFGFSWMVSGILKPLLSEDTVRNLGETSSILNDFNGRLRFLENELNGIVVHGKVSNCSHSDSKWEINQDGLLLNSRCVLFKSATEEVGIWGWPLQTAGLLTTGFSSRSFTILSGRVTQWSNGNVGFLIREAKTSWLQRKWGASVMQLDPNTWILEYRRSSILDNSRLCSAVFEFLKQRISSGITRMNEEFWLFSVFQNQYRKFTATEHIKVPT